MENYKELIASIAAANGLTQAATRKIAEELMLGILSVANTHGSCNVGRHNYFKKIEKAARPYRDMRTGEHKLSNPKTVIIFKRVVDADLVAKLTPVVEEVEAISSLS